MLDINKTFCNICNLFTQKSVQYLCILFTNLIFFVVDKIYPAFSLTSKAKIFRKAIGYLRFKISRYFQKIHSEGLRLQRNFHSKLSLYIICAISCFFVFNRSLYFKNQTKYIHLKCIHYPANIRTTVPKFLLENFAFQQCFKDSRIKIGEQNVEQNSELFSSFNHFHFSLPSKVSRFTKFYLYLVSNAQSRTQFIVEK